LKQNFSVDHLLKRCNCAQQADGQLAPFDVGTINAYFNTMADYHDNVDDEWFQDLYMPMAVCWNGGHSFSDHIVVAY